MNKARIIRFIRNTSISIGVLLVAAVGLGVGYTWYMGQGDNSSAIAEPVEAVSLAPEVKHVQRAANAPVSASVQSLTTPIDPGSNASITVRSVPEAECVIKVEYNKIPSKDSGLVAKTTDEFGMVTWAWTVEPSVPLGKWPVDVTCTLGEKSGFVRGDLVIGKPTS